MGNMHHQHHIPPPTRRDPGVSPVKIKQEQGSQLDEAKSEKNPEVCKKFLFKITF